MDELIYAQKKTVASGAMEEEVHMIPETIFVFNQAGSALNFHYGMTI